MLPLFVCEVTLGYMLAYRNCKYAEQLKFTITICGSYNMGKPDIIYEDNDIIVCCKPAGIATPVSYTHLDVYKRQHICGMAAWLTTQVTNL